MKKVCVWALTVALLVGMFTATAALSASAGTTLDAYVAGGITVQAYGVAGTGSITVESGGASDGGYVVQDTSYSVIKIADVDFGETGAGKASFHGNSGAEGGFAVELRLDSATGTLVGTFERDTATDGGWSAGADKVAADIAIDPAVTGVHDVYLVYVRDAANFYGVSFEEKTGGDPQPPAPVEKQADAYVAGGLTVQAYGEAGTGIMTVESGNATDGGYIIDNTAYAVIKITGVDFGETGAKKAFFYGNTGVELGFAAELRLDAVNGELIGTFERTSPTDEGWSGGADKVAAEFDISVAVTGVHDVYLVFVRDAANFYGVSFEEKVGGDPQPPTPVEKQVDAYVAGGITVQAYGDAGTGIMTVESGNATDGGYIIDNTSYAIIKIAGVSFGETGAVKAYFYGNSGAELGFAVELRLDSEDGTLVDTFERTSATDEGWSGGADKVAAEIAIDPAVTGVHDVYLVFVRDAANFYGVSFEKAAGEPMQAPGDVNADGAVDSKDARLVLQYAVDAAELTGDALIAADMNKDGGIDSKDARLILQTAVS